MVYCEDRYRVLSEIERQIKELEALEFIEAIEENLQKHINKM
jgi:hypothetical protein